MQSANQLPNPESFLIENIRIFFKTIVQSDDSGLGNATVSASQSATLNLSGMGSVTVYGKPQNRNVVVDGLGKVSWK